MHGYNRGIARKRLHASFVVIRVYFSREIQMSHDINKTGGFAIIQKLVVVVVPTDWLSADVFSFTMCNKNSLLIMKLLLINNSHNYQVIVL